ncbi:MAG TPA: methyltransferase domain-containing protein [Verrucomicrobiales bacterium]|nr:methyltransferase domain-containing protein [Verrucomicrobiales bacterium]
MKDPILLPESLEISRNQEKVRSRRAAKPGKGTGRSRLTDILGPVEDLESYVKADWWRHLFNANYLRTDGDVVEDTVITRSEVDLFSRLMHLETDTPVLDVCCGQGRHCLELARRGFTAVTGIDRSHYLISRARGSAKNEQLGVVFREGDARRLPFGADRFAAVSLAGNSFGYFETAEDDARVLREVLRVLQPGGILLLDVTDGEHIRQTYQPRSWEWIDRNYFVCRERSLSADGQRLISREVITHTRKGVVADQFYAERLYRADDLRSLLADNGFRDSELHEEIFTASLRNQDLGMMGKRLVFTARADKSPAGPKKPARPMQRVAVLLGDPRKHDAVKPDGTFDDDDYHTLNELKNALAGLKGYQFTFFDDHDRLLEDAMTAKAECDFVFNLCDEGFGNDAAKELHVPALLEMLGIPYTGGTPQCLAYCYDKSLVRGIAVEMGLPAPRAAFIRPDETAFIDLAIPFPVILKPNSGDSSFGITADSVCQDVAQMEAALVRLRERCGYDKPILVEEFLTGEDISVGILGNVPEDPTLLPIIREDYSELPDGLPRICGYEAKWDPASPYATVRSVPAGLGEETERFLYASCLQLFERLGCRDYARFDWRLDARGTPRLLEVNPNPGWCWDGHLNKMADLHGLSYQDMLGRILGAAVARFERGKVRR